MHPLNGLEFQSTLPVGGATSRSDINRSILAISIHAPRGGSDTKGQPPSKVLWHFNPRSPWGERPGGITGIESQLKFQSTLPVGGATWPMLICVSTQTFQSTLPVGGATRISFFLLMDSNISIHAPRGGSDPVCDRRQCLFPDFNPRSPWGERLLSHTNSLINYDFNPRSPWGERPPPTTIFSTLSVISIHAPRGGSDPRSSVSQA